MSSSSPSRRQRVTRVVSLSEETHRKEIEAMAAAAASVQSRRSNLTGLQQEQQLQTQDEGEKSIREEMSSSIASPSPTSSTANTRAGGLVSFVEEQTATVTVAQKEKEKEASEQQQEHEKEKEAPKLPLPPHKKSFPSIYDEKASLVSEDFLKELSKMFSTQFFGLHLTPIDTWGADDDAEAALIASGDFPSAGGENNSGSAMLSSSTNRNNQIRMGRRRSSIAQQTMKGTYSVLSRLSGTRDATEITSGNTLFDENHKLTFTSDGSTGSGQRIGETTPPTVLVSVTANPVRVVGGMLLIDGAFAFHNSPFLDKRSPPGRVKVPVDRDLVRNVQQMVAKSKEWQNLILNKHSSSSSSIPTSDPKQQQQQNASKKIKIGSDNDNSSEDDNNEPKIIVGGQDSLLETRRQSSISSKNNTTSSRRNTTTTTTSTRSMSISNNNRKMSQSFNSSSNNDDNLNNNNMTATLLFHEYAGAASPADDWVIQTFQLIDPSSGHPAGPTVLRGYKTQAAIQRRERKIEMVQSQMHQHELMMMQQGVGGGGGGRSGSIFAKRGSVLLDKYSLSTMNQEGVASFRTPGSMRRKSLSQSLNPNGSPSTTNTSGEQQVIIAGGGACQRQLLPEEEVLRFRNPALFSWVATQDLFELLAATNVIRNSIQQYRSSFIVRRTLKRMFVSVGVIQRFCRSLSRRRQSALQRILRDWCKLESDFVQKLRKYKPLEGDVIDGLVAKSLADNAITPHEEKKKRVEDAWRASRWEIAVAWRISSAFSPSSFAPKETPFSNSNSSGNDTNNNENDEDQQTQQQHQHISLTQAYDQWAKEHKVVRKRVFSYFISAKPLFEAAQRRLAIQCGFGKNSVYRGPGMLEILNKAGCSISEMQKRRREIFLFEAQLAEAQVLKKRQREQQVLREELMRREEEKSMFGGQQSKSYSATTGESNFFQTQQHQAMAGRRGAFSQQQNNTQQQQQQIVSSLSLPPKPAEYDEGEFTAIQNVLLNERFDIYYDDNNYGGGGKGSRKNSQIKPLRRLKQPRRRSSSAFSSFSAFGGGGGNNNNQNDNEDDYYYSPQDEEEKEQAKLVAAIRAQQGLDAHARRRPFGDNPPPPWLMLKIQQQAQTARNSSSSSTFHLPQIATTTSRSLTTTTQNQNNNGGGGGGSPNTTLPDIKQRQRAHVPILQMQPSSSNLLLADDSFVAPTWGNNNNHNNKNSEETARRDSTLSINNNGAYISAEKLKEQRQNVLRRGIALPWVHQQQEKDAEERRYK